MSTFIFFLSFLMTVFCTSFASARTRTSIAPGIYVQEENPGVSARFRRLKFTDGSLTNNGDGSVSIENGVDSILLCDKTTDNFCFVYENSVLKLYVNQKLQMQWPSDALITVLTADDATTILTADNGLTQLTPQ